MKTPTKLKDAIALIPDGATVMIGGFFGVGSPHRLIQGLASSGRKNLRIITNDTAYPGRGVGKLVEARAAKRLIISHVGANTETQRQMLAGELEVELVPQGTLAERIRAGASGLGGVLTKTGLGTVVERDKLTIKIDGETWLLEKPLRADFALINAWQADYLGNLTYQLTAQNFNPVMAMAAATVMVEAAEIVPVGTIPPDSVRTPGTLVDYLLERPT
jgi:acetate CoA/acetoacetate CoA-transferase alpha subunit